MALRRLRTPARRRRRRWCRAVRGDERGSVSAELVLATPLLLVLIMGVVQFALWEHATHVADAVAQQGLAVGRLQGETAAAGQAEATNNAHPIKLILRLTLQTHPQMRCGDELCC